MPERGWRRIHPSPAELIAFATLCTSLGLVYAFGYEWRDRLPAGAFAERLALGQLTSWLWGAAIPFIAAVDRGVARRSALAVFSAHAVAGVAIMAVVFTARWMFGTGALDVVTTRPVRYVVMWMDVGAITYLILLGVVRARRAYAHHAHRTEVTLRLEADVANTRLEFLRRQLEPHFLFNSLNCVAELAHESTDAALYTVRQLRRLLRSVVSDKAGAEITLRDELETIDAYLEIQKARFRDRLIVARAVDDAVLDSLVPRFILQPIVENAIKYGLGDSRHPGRVTIAASGDGSRIRLAVTNTHSRPHAHRTGGIAATGPIAGHGVGLANVRDRLAELYGDDFVLRLEPNDDGKTTVTVELARRTAPAVSAPRGTDVQSVARDAAQQGTDAPGSDLAGEALPRPAGHLAVQVLGMTAFLLVVLAVSIFAVERFSFAAPARMWERWSYQLVGLAVGVALLPPLVFAVRRIPRLFHSARARLVATYLGLPIVYSMAYGVVVIPLQLRAGAMITAGFFLRQVVLGITFPLVMVILVHYNDLVRWYHEKASAELKLRASLASERWRLRRMRVDPGFLLRTLGWIEQRLADGDVRGAEQIIRRFAGVLRLVVASANDDEVTLERELALLRAYTDVWKETITRVVDLSIDVPTALLERRVPNRVFASELETVADDRGDAAEIDVRLDALEIDDATVLRLNVHVRGSVRGALERSAEWTIPEPVSAPAGTHALPSPLTPALS